MELRSEYEMEESVIDKNDAPGGKFLVYTSAVVFFATFVLINAFREIILDKTMLIILVGILVLAVLSGPLTAFVMKWLSPKLIATAAMGLICFGYLLWLVPESPIYVAPESLGMVGWRPVEFYPIYLLAIACMLVPYAPLMIAITGVMQYETRSNTRGGSIAGGMLMAFCVHHMFRIFDWILIPAIQIGFIFIGIIVWLRWLPILGDNRQQWKQTQNQNTTKTGDLRHAMALLFWVPISMFYFLPFLNPEILAYAAGVSYPSIVADLVFAVAIGIIAALGLINIFKRQAGLKGPISWIIAGGNCLFGLLFASYFFLPAGHPGYIVIYFLAFFFMTVHTILLISEIFAHYSRFLELGMSLAIILSIGLNMGIRLIIIERHMPYLWFIVMLPIIGSHLALIYRFRKQKPTTSNPSIPRSDTIGTNESDRAVPVKKIKKTISVGLLFVIILLPGFAIGISAAVAAPPDYEKAVWASLYTWYGVPSGPAGKYGLPQLDGSAATWTPSASFNITSATNGSDLVVTGTALQAGDTLALTASVLGVFSPSVRTYIELAMTVGNFAAGPVILEIVTPALIYRTSIENRTADPNQYLIVNKVFPLAAFFTNTTNPDPDALPAKTHQIRIVQTVTTPGPVNLSVHSIEISRWKHYDEDYHTFESSEKPGFWYNDPPIFKATAHNVFYNQSTGPWPEVETYGYYDHGKWNEVPLEEASHYGIYDSLDPVVLRSQLRLMELAGIDVVQIMHPWGFDVIQAIFDTAIAINSNLSFFLYADTNITYISRLMNEFAYDPIYGKYYYRINDQPVYNYGFTGEPNTVPLTALIGQIRELKRHYSIYLIADGFSSPYAFRDEFLSIYDGWYYYDTSAFYRHGWGDPAIENYQADGTLMPYNAWNQLDFLFGGLAAACHAKSKSYAAIIIPGTDNTCVHDFIGSPLYDGRTGTINTRENGLTYNRTWEAAIASGADHACIVSWNELHEGTEIEPTVENGTIYVELTRIWSDRFRNA
jgi:hypothetical protein